MHTSALAAPDGGNDGGSREGAAGFLSALWKDTREVWLAGEEFPATIGLNEKGGMNDAELEKYVENNLLHLFPDVIDEPGKIVCLKVDNGPGRKGRSLLLKMRFKGWYMYPSLPNATSVQQGTDINYGPFKTAVSERAARARRVPKYQVQYFPSYEKEKNYLVPQN